MPGTHFHPCTMQSSHQHKLFNGEKKRILSIFYQNFKFYSTTIPRCFGNGKTSKIKTSLFTIVHRDEEWPAHRDEGWPLLATTGESPHTKGRLNTAKNK